jgi:hypothetical protein
MQVKHCSSFIMIVTLMKPSTTASSKVAAVLVLTVLALVPFHAFVTVWGSTLVGHYLVLRLWDDVAALVVIAIAGAWVLRDQALRKWLAGSLLVRLIGAYVGLTVLLGLVALTRGEVTVHALCYGLLSNLRYIVWFLAVLIVAQHVPRLRQHWPRLVLIPASVVVLFAVAQFTVLPHDFLAHFGYGASTIAPIETINHNQNYIRVQSTLRGANPLGAYLVVILSAVGVVLARGRWRWAMAALGAIATVALFASGSRSAWIGVVLAVLVIVWRRLPSRQARVVMAVSCVGVAVLAASLFVALRDNTDVQNAILHTQTNSHVATTSNSAHLDATVDGLRDVVHQPLGDGPGTAGPASAHNGTHGVRVAENYYVQIAQETGWLGLTLFIAIVTLVAAELYQRAKTSPLALTLLAALVGMSFVNLLSHAWADDTLAFLWWGLAGIALSAPPAKKGKHARVSSAGKLA